MVVWNPSAAVPSKEVWGCVYSGNPAPVNSGCTVNLAGEWGEAQIIIPQDFATITDIELILLPLATGASMHVEIMTAWGSKDGAEAYNVHTETGTDRNVGATVANQNLAHDIADLCNIVALSPGDLLRVTLLYNVTAVATNLQYRGVRLKYE